MIYSSTVESYGDKSVLQQPRKGQKAMSKYSWIHRYPRGRRSGW